MNRHLKKLLSFRRPEATGASFVQLYTKFRTILKRSNQIHELMADMEGKLGGEYIFDGRYIEEMVARLGETVLQLITDLAALTRKENVELFHAFERVRQEIEAELKGRYLPRAGEFVLPLRALGPESGNLAGEKMAGLGNIRNRLMLPTADGFVITTLAFAAFMEKNDLAEKTRLGTACWRDGDDAGLRRVAREIQKTILKGAMPRGLLSRILSGYDELAKRTGQPGLRVALRSSAWGEDGESSFAGQYSTILNISRDRLEAGYREVIASCYGYGAWRYRLQKGYHEHETAMAVGCQAMVRGLVSGVLHTFAPHIARGNMVINAAWGLCEQVVQGEQAADTIVLDRRPPYHMISEEIASKSSSLMPAERSGTIRVETAPEKRNILSLTPAQMTDLAQAAMSIEMYGKRPQEIEWSYDTEGNLRILQARPLHFHGSRLVPGTKLQEDIRQADIIFSNRGYPVQCGIGVGRVFVVRTEEDLEQFPHGAILLARHSSPRYAAIMHKARGVITEIGSPTGHMATLAREYRVPTVVNTEIAMQLLNNGDEVTLDATHNIVYRGYLYALDSFELTREEVFEDSREFRLLRRLTAHVRQLNLVASPGEAFVPAACRTYHDIAQYIQMKAVEELIQLSGETEMKDVLPPKRLETEIPLGLLIIDGGGGTEGPSGTSSLGPEQIVSLPLKELLHGILKPGMWCTDPVSVNLNCFMSSFTRTFCTSLAGPQEVGRNLAVVLKNYANINLRLGYHFTSIDACISEAVDENYIDFRFWGGVTESVRRYRRATFIARVLERFDFLVDTRGDLVVGRVKKMALPHMSRRMRMLGGLVGYTRQLDADMNSDSDIARHAEIFIEAMNRIPGGEKNEQTGYRCQKASNSGPG